MDSLIIKSLAIAAQIGVHDWEQKIKQNLLLDITIPSDFNRCKDELTETLDYDALCHSVTEFVGSKSFKLIETVANEVAALIQQEFQVAKLTVAVAKPHAVKNAGMIQVVVERGL